MARLPHLSRRFLESIRSSPLTPAEQRRVAGWLRPAEAGAFWGQQAVDQRHALTAAALVSSRAPERIDLIRAALLHDVGKRHARLGVAGRVLASLLGLLRLPTPGRLGLHLRHGPLGAAELERLGVERVVAAFAAGHHGPCPEDADPADWALLREADGE